MFYMYLLQGEDGTHYVGYTSDLKQRVNAHQAGSNESTRYQCWELVYYEAYKTEQQARDRERKLKHHGRVYQLLIRRLEND